MIEKLKSWIKKKINSRYLELFSKKWISITKIPKYNCEIVSDLFPYRIENSWNTFFELLNYKKLLYPNTNTNEGYAIEIRFFDKKGTFLNKYLVENYRDIKTTLNIKYLLNSLNINSDGTFAVFHQIFPNWLQSKKSFLAERGYIGYENKNFGPIKSFVHGNLDAISQTIDKKETLLGNSSFTNKKYQLQHEFSFKFSYELFWSNPTNNVIKLEIFENTIKNNKVTILQIPSRGIKSYRINPNDKKLNAKVIVKSKLYIARPLIFKYMSSSFDVFHG